MGPAGGIPALSFTAKEHYEDSTSAIPALPDDDSAESDRARRSRRSARTSPAHPRTKSPVAKKRGRSPFGGRPTSRGSSTGGKENRSKSPGVHRALPRAGRSEQEYKKYVAAFMAGLKTPDAPDHAVSEINTANGPVRTGDLSVDSIVGIGKPSWKWNPAEHLADVEDELDLGGF